MLPCLPAHRRVAPRPACRDDSHAAVLLLQPDFRANDHSGSGPVHTRLSALDRGQPGAAPFVWLARDRVRTYVSTSPRHWLLLGFLGMWICGAGVYYALQFTTATNATLIYTTSPLMVILLERLFFGRATSWRELAGIAIGFFGVAIIVLKGDLDSLAGLDLNRGDLMFIAAALSWAVYSVLLRGARTSGLPVSALFGTITIAGALLLAPFALWEWMSAARMPSTQSAWGGIAGIVVFSSLLAFGGYQYGVARLGASTTSIFMYLLPVYGVGLRSLPWTSRFMPTTRSASSPCWVVWCWRQRQSAASGNPGPSRSFRAPERSRAARTPSWPCLRSGTGSR
jgi:drug/metabolite transporter (DMT)-like permease